MIRKSLFIVVLFQIFNCMGVNYKELSLNDPFTLIEMQDSLLIKNSSNQNLREALVLAHNNVAKQYLRDGKLNLAVDYLSKSILINGDDKSTKFSLMLAEGRLLIKKGNKNGIWDAIEKFSKAAKLFPKDGEPFYWIAVSYTKLGDTDFDLILESYEKSLSLDLDQDLRIEIEKNYNIAKNRKIKLDTFWN